MRNNGRVIGPSLNLYNPSAGGIWTLPDARDRLIYNDWPQPYADPYFDKVVFLSHCDGDNNATYVRAAKGSAPVAGYNAKLTTTTSKFGASSLAFDGTNDRLVATSPDFTFGTEDFTIEFWMNPTTGGHGGSWSRIIELGQNATNGGLWMVCTSTDNPCKILCQTYAAGYSDVAVTTNTIPNGQWTHVALCRKGTTYYLFINGTQDGGITNSTGATITATELFIGANSAASEAYLGYLDEIRITRGVARYTANFTAPTRPFPDRHYGDVASSLWAYDPYWSTNTVLLMHMNGTDQSTTFTDQKGHTMTARGNAKIVTAQSKFGGACAYFDGTGDMVDSASSADFTFGTGEWTVECWAKFEDASAGIGVWSFAPQNATTPVGFNLRYNTASPGYLYVDCHWNADGVRWVAPTVTEWHHYAVQRTKSGAIELFVDGIFQTPYAYNGVGVAHNLNCNDTYFSVGAMFTNNNTTLPFKGWIDEVRVTKGVARYRGNFALPTGPYPDS